MIKFVCLFCCFFFIKKKNPFFRKKKDLCKKMTIEKYLHFLPDTVLIISLPQVIIMGYHICIDSDETSHNSVSQFKLLSKR